MPLNPRMSSGRELCWPGPQQSLPVARDPSGHLQRWIPNPRFHFQWAVHDLIFCFLLVQKAKGTSPHSDFFPRLHQRGNGWVWPDCKMWAEIFARFSKVFQSFECPQLGNETSEEMRRYSRFGHIGATFPIRIRQSRCAVPCAFEPRAHSSDVSMESRNLGH